MRWLESDRTDSPLWGLSLRDAIADDGSYKQIIAKRELVWDNMVELHTNVSILEQIRTFSPFLAGAGLRFLNYVAGTVFRYSCVMVARVWTDTQPETVTMRKLINEIARAMRSDLRKPYKDRAKANYPDPATERRIERARHKHIAHLELQASIVDQERDLGVSFNDLRDVTTALGSTYNAMNLDSHSMFVLTSFDFDNRGGGTLGAVLDALALRSQPSKFWNDHPELWEEIMAPRISRADLDRLNRIRQRHGYSHITGSAKEELCEETDS